MHSLLAFMAFIDNYWVLTSGGPFTFPTSIKLQSCLGATITDAIPGGPVGTFTGKQQFPVSSKYKSVPASGSIESYGEPPAPGAYGGAPQWHLRCCGRFPRCCRSSVGQADP